MIGTVTGARAVIAAVVLLLGVTACSGDDPEPKVAPTPSSSAASSDPSDPSTSPVAAALGPEETVRAWVEAQNEALASGDSTAVRALASPNCTSCDGLIDPIDEVFSNGGHFETSGWAVDRAKRVSGSDDRATVNTAITIAGGTSYASEGAEALHFEAERSIVVFKLVRHQEAWLIDFVGFLS